MRVQPRLTNQIDAQISLGIVHQKQLSKSRFLSFKDLIGAVTHTTVKGISQVYDAVVNFSVVVVYRGNFWLHMN